MFALFPCYRRRDRAAVRAEPAAHLGALHHLPRLAAGLGLRSRRADHGRRAGRRACQVRSFAWKKFQCPLRRTITLYVLYWYIDPLQNTI